MVVVLPRCVLPSLPFVCCARSLSVNLRQPWREGYASYLASLPPYYPSRFHMLLAEKNAAFAVPQQLLSMNIISPAVEK